METDERPNINLLVTKVQEQITTWYYLQKQIKCCNFSVVFCFYMKKENVD